MNESEQLILDGTKIQWHQERVDALDRGERIAPITIDIALTRACNYGCHFCYAMLQENENKKITKPVITRFLEDCAEIGVKGISIVGDGESSVSPLFTYTIQYGAQLGLSMAVASNGYAITAEKAREILPYLTYLRINFSAGEKDRYAEIMGVKPEWYDKVCENISEMAQIKKANNLPVTLGMQMVTMPEYADQIVPLAKLAKELRPDYLVLKHCSDDEDGNLGVDYGKYKEIENQFKLAEAYSDEDFKVIVKWSKIKANGKRSYQRCYSTPFFIQLSGTGLVTTCSQFFNEKYKKFHFGNICDTSLKEICSSDHYWEVMRYLSSIQFNAQHHCGNLCLQHKVNEALDAHNKRQISIRTPEGIAEPMHVNYI